MINHNATQSKAMRLLLIIDDGPAAGESFRVRHDEDLQFGRTSWADHSIPEDDQMAEVHFAIETSHSACRVRDLDSPTGIRVNGVQVTEAELLHGDVVVAGQTSFRVQFAHAAPSHGPSIRPAPSLATDFKYRADVLPSGLTVYRSSEKKAPWRRLVNYLAQKQPMHLLVNFKAIDAPLPEELGAAVDLFEPLPASVRQTNSLVLISAEDQIDRAELLELAWKQDAVTALFSELDKETLQESLRSRCAHFCRPSAICCQLYNSPAEHLDTLLWGLGAVLTEDNETDGWRLFSNSQLIPSWKDLGLPAPPA